VRQSEPSELGRLLSRHNGRIVASLSGGWLLYFVLIVAGGSVAAAVAVGARVLRDAAQSAAESMSRIIPQGEVP